MGKSLETTKKDRKSKKLGEDTPPQKGGKSKSVTGKDKKKKIDSTNIFQTLADDKDDTVLNTCKVCHESLDAENDDFIVCDRCEQAVCFRCSKIQASDFPHLAKKDSGMWFCFSCKKPALEAIKTDFQIEEKCAEYMRVFREEFKEEMNIIREEITEHKEENRLEMQNLREETEQKLEQISQKCESMRLKIEQTELKKSKTPNSSTTSTDDKTQNNPLIDITKELDDRENRKRNVVWFGIPESNAEEPEERKQADLRYVKKIGQQVYDMNTSDKIFLTARRLGRFDKNKPNRKRPLLTTLDTAERADYVIRNAKNFGLDKNKNYKDKNISVKKDMTKAEQEQVKRLLALRFQKRQETKKNNSGEIWIIKGGKVVDIARRKQETEETATDPVTEEEEDHQD